jgi:hypothetical protein
MIKRTLLALSAAFAVLAMGTATPTVAQGIGGVGGINPGVPSGIQINPGSSLNLGPSLSYNIPRTPQRFRDLKLAGHVGVDPAKLPPDAKVVRLYLDGHNIPMRLDTELHSAEIQFAPEASYGRDLYRAILTKRVEVVGAADLRQALQSAADNHEQAEVEGYAFNLSSPYLVLREVRRAP